MLTIILILAIVILLALLVFACYQINWERGYSKDLSRQLDEANSNYAALEEGRDEETESYQQELLTADEKIAEVSMERDAVIKSYNELTDEVLFHRDRCLPSLGGLFEPDSDNEEPTPVFDVLFDIVYA